MRRIEKIEAGGQRRKKLVLAIQRKLLVCLVEKDSRWKISGVDVTFFELFAKAASVDIFCTE